MIEIAMIRKYTLAFALVSVLAAKEIRFQTDRSLGCRSMFRQMAKRWCSTC